MFCFRQEEKTMSDDTLNERVQLALIEVDELIYNWSNVNYFITEAIESYKKVVCVFANGARRKDWELYEARRNVNWAERKALETGERNELKRGYQDLSRVCREVAISIQKRLDQPRIYDSLLRFYKRGKQIMMGDAEKYAILAKK